MTRSTQTTIGAATLPSAAPVPTRPRVPVTASYGLHRIVAKNPGWAALAPAIEAHPRVERVFTLVERTTKQHGFGCRMCGQCALPETGYACPMTCPKQLRNGPCGGVGDGGTCEVYPEQRCVWVEGIERASAHGHEDDLARLQRPIDHRRFGESSWVNYWSGRDDELSATRHPGEPLPPIKPLRAPL